jgi:hypothetical protein
MNVSHTLMVNLTVPCLFISNCLESVGVAYLCLIVCGKLVNLEQVYWKDRAQKRRVLLSKPTIREGDERCQSVGGTWSNICAGRSNRMW